LQIINANDDRSNAQIPMLVVRGDHLGQGVCAEELGCLRLLIPSMMLGQGEGF
jgi:hypothetical protein